jgi:hypothetical protein
VSSEFFSSLSHEDMSQEVTAAERLELSDASPRHDLLLV